MRTFILALLMLLSLPAAGEIFTATGTAPVVNGNVADARNKAVEEALRQALLQSGARISTEQSARNGRLTIHNIRLSSDSQIRRYSVVEQKEHGDYIEVTVKADIFNKAGVCKGKQFAKTLTPLLFSYDEGQADNSERQLHDFNRELTRQFHSRLLNSKDTFSTKPWIDQAYRIDLRSVENETGDAREQLRHLARLTDSQYLLLGSIRDIGFGEKEDDGLFSVFSSKEIRNISFSVYLVDGYTGELVFAKNYADSAEWKYDKRDRVDLRGDRFWKTAYGQKISSLITAAAAEVTREAMCQKLRAYIVRVDGGRYHINAGEKNHVKAGDTFELELSANFRDSQRHQRLNTNAASGTYIVEKVTPDGAVLVRDPKTRGESNIQIGDLARAK